MAAIVECDDAAAVFLQLRNPGRIYPVHILGRRKAVHEQDRIALAFVEVGNLNSAVMKTRHRLIRIFGRGIGDGGRKLSRARPRPPGTAQTAKPQPLFAFLTARPSCEAAKTWSGVRWWL